ncbi:unnamed protein product [Nippostrongylus brasiliensis]|uniref:FMRFamide receptor (inferred by orthology to a D. melanogaster protein) n=1 Tax=Nippostrongylus brasiliensis TaxID=27835 RepID=A0A0N4YK41_NIPBR|nr:unnamed protein product [Nippostrongylus brasiliensis]
MRSGCCGSSTLSGGIRQDATLVARGSFIFRFTIYVARGAVVLLCGLSLFDVLVLSSTLLIYPAMNACQNEPDPIDSRVCHFFWRSTLIAYPLSLIAQAGRERQECRGSLLQLVFDQDSVLFKLPAFFEIVLNESGQIMPSALRLDPTYQLIYMTYMYLIFILLLPWTAIIVLNAIVINKV